MDFLDRKKECADILQSHGIQIRFEDLAGAPSGLCRIKGQLTLLIDLAMNSREQLELLESVSQQILKKSNRTVA